jgi:hypothetical protein
MLAVKRFTTFAHPGTLCGLHFHSPSILHQNHTIRFMLQSYDAFPTVRDHLVYIQSSPPLHPTQIRLTQSLHTICTPSADFSHLTTTSHISLGNPACFLPPAASQSHEKTGSRQLEHLDVSAKRFHSLGLGSQSAYRHEGIEAPG